MKKPVLAIVIPCFNEELCIKDTAQALLNLLGELVCKEKIDKKSYLYFVDDGSSDSTWELIEELHNGNKLVKGLRFIRNFGNQKALIAGLEGVREIGCDCAVSIDADLQQDEHAIEKFIDEYQKGADVVAGIRNGRKTDSFLKKWTALLFYKTMYLLGAKIPVNHSDYRLVSKRTLDIMGQYPEKYLFLRGFFNEVGLKTAYVKFDVKPRAQGESKFNYLTLTGLALNGITSFSIVPLRIIAVLGFLMALFGFGIGVWSLWEKFVWSNSPNGITTAIILSSFFGGIQLFCLGIIGEYVGQVYREVKGRPRYIKDVELK